MEGVKEVPAFFLHADCITSYAKRHNTPYGKWLGVKVAELPKEHFTIYTINPEILVG